MEDSGADPALAKAEPVTRLGPGELLALAEKCEGLDHEGDRMIDRLIKEALEIGKPWTRATPQASQVWALHYTTSLDAALTLVPEGSGFTAQQLGHPCFWTIFLPGGAQHEGQGHTPVLALCAAALRALAPTDTRSAKKEDK